MSGVLTPLSPLPHSISRTGNDTITSKLLTTWTSLSSTLQVRPFSQRGTTRPWHRFSLHSEMEPNLWPGFVTPPSGKRLDTSLRRTVAESVNDTSFIWSYRQASLGGTTSLRLCKKREL